MNFELIDLYEDKLVHHQLDEAIAALETLLQHSVPSKTGFHEILGRDFLHHTADLLVWFEYYFKSISRKIEIKSVYLEMNAFEINTDAWYADLFFYNKDGGLEDLEWLGEWTRETASRKPFPLTGMEAVQQAFEAYAENPAPLEELIQARDICEHLVILRFMQLLEGISQKIRGSALAYASLPIYCTVHDFDMVYQTA